MFKMAEGRPTRDATRLKVITAHNKSVIAPENILKLILVKNIKQII